MGHAHLLRNFALTQANFLPSFNQTLQQSVIGLLKRDGSRLPGLSGFGFQAARHLPSVGNG